MFPKELGDFQSLAEAACNVWVPGAKVEYRSLRPGFSGAAILRVDVRGTRQSQVESGQYVLKLSNHSQWRTFESEVDSQDKAYKFNEAFAKFHIPALVRSLDLPEQGGYALLYEIAGASLDAYASVDGPEKPEFRQICQALVSDLLFHWSAGEPSQVCQPHLLLENWLGYRLQPGQASGLHELVRKMVGVELVWNDAGEMLINPIKFYELTKNDDVAEISVVNAWLHYDLHGGNLLVHRLQPLDKPYQLVDLGQSRLGPTGFDQAYLEMAQIVYSLGENDPAQLINLLRYLDDPSAPSLLPPHTSWLYECLKKMRTAFDEWRDRTHPRRVDDLNRQMRLAQVAAGLHWANKPLPEEQRYLGLCYAGWAAREYLRLHEPTMWNSLWPRHRDRRSTATPGTTSEADYALWEELWRQVQGFSPTAGKFVLVAEAQCEAASLQLEDKTSLLVALGQLPWSAVIDLDPASDNRGLHYHATPVLQSHRGLHTFDRRLPTVNYTYGTSWMMAAGWELKGQPSTDYNNWRFDMMPLIRSFAREIETKTNPDPVYVLALPGSSLDPNNPLARVSLVLDALDEATRSRARIFLLGSHKLHLSFEYTHLPLHPQTFLQFVVQTFGHRPRSGVASIPGSQNDQVVARELPMEDLRALQENLVVLHSNILNETNSQVVDDNAAFWRGAPPSWADLQQGIDIPRSVHADLLSRLRTALSEPSNRTVVLYHHPGAGATTTAYRAAWDLHHEYPTCILTRWSEGLSARLQKLYHLAQRPILLIAEFPTLTESQREDLHRNLLQNNTPVILLYVQYGFVHQEDSSLKLEDPMTLPEAKVFYERYQALVDDSLRRQELKRITHDENLARYRTPFFYGLITHERQFMAVDRYVGTHLKGLRGKARDLLEYIALVTIYSNTGLPETLIKLMLGLAENAHVSLVEIFGEGPSRLIASRQGRLRLMHQVIAEEVLSDLLGGGRDQWQFELHHLSVDIIREVVAVASPDSQMVYDLFRQIFIERAGSERDEVDDRGDFAPLIMRIDAIDRSLGHRVLTNLTEACPQGAHFWNHLGRHQVYKMRRDFEKAEQHLHTAINLSPYDYLHHHTLGVVLRSRVRATISSLRGTTGRKLLEAICSDFDQAAEAFEKSRELSPENIYGYITHTQMILDVADGFKELLHAQNIGLISDDERPVQEWIAQNIPIAHKLLNEANQLYGTLNQTNTYLTQCYAGLRKLYGDLDQVITIWEVADARGNRSPASRRALANAYLARNESRWSLMQHSELRRVVELMELNIHSSGRRDEDYRIWFEAYKLLPEFDIDEALAKLRLWIGYFPSWRAYYYVYILMFHLWYSGRSNSTDEMENALEECQKRIIGRRNHSGLWLGYKPEYCPLVSATELGDWDRRANFWSDASQLRSVNGVIDDPILSVRAGWILVDGKVRVFFVPAAGDFTPLIDENRPVSFFLGFSPSGLRAWDVKPGHVPGHDRVRPGKPAASFQPAFSAEPVVSEQEKRERVRKLKYVRVMTFIEDLMQAKSQIGADLTLEELEQRIEATFGIDGIAAALGVTSLRSLLRDLSGYLLVDDGSHTYVRLVDQPRRETRTVHTMHTGQVVYFHQARDYGFIDDGSTEQYYFRRSHILPEYRQHSIYHGAVVEFVPEMGLKGPMAIKISFPNVQPETQVEGELAQRVEAKVRQVLNDALITSQTVLYKDLCDQLFEAFPGRGKLTDRLGVNTMAAFLNTLAGVRITGEFPELYVELQEKRTFGRLSSSKEARALPAAQAEYLREQIRSYLLQLVAESNRNGGSLELARLAYLLKERFPGEPVYKRLGFEKLGEMVKSLDGLTIEYDGNRAFLAAKGQLKAVARDPGARIEPSKASPTKAASTKTTPPTILSKPVESLLGPDKTQVVPSELLVQVKAFIDEQLENTRVANKLLEVTTLGHLLASRFPGQRIHKLLGYRRLTDFLHTLSEYTLHTLGNKQVLALAGEILNRPAEPLIAHVVADGTPDSSQPFNLSDHPTELRQAVETFTLGLVRQLDLDGQYLNVPSLGVELIARFPGERVYKRLGYKRLADLVNSFPTVEIQVVGATQVVVLKGQNAIAELPADLADAPPKDTSNSTSLDL